MKKRKMKIGVLMASVLLATGLVAMPAQAKSWSVYAQQGAYKQQQIVSMTNYGNGYIAKCTGASGNAAAKQTVIKEYSNSGCTKAVSLNKNVVFTTANTSIAFKHLSMPAVDTVYMKVNLTYSNGTSASMSGTITTN